MIFNHLLKIIHLLRALREFLFLKFKMSHTTSKGKGGLMKKQNFFLCMLISYGIVTTPCFAKKAVVIKPVIDLIGSPIAEFFPGIETQKAYEQIPLCGANKNAWNNCPRLHQLLFNETVEVLEENSHEVKIKSPDIFYITPQTKDRHNVFWTLKSNIMRLSELHTSGIDAKQFPGTHPSCSVITLKKPFTVLKTGITYSAGTRFVTETLAATNAIALIFNPETKNIEKTIIPQSFFFLPGTTPEQKIDTFLTLVKMWSSEHYIPYVWGGCSFISTHEKDFLNSGKCYDRASCTTIKNGFDCAGLVLRAAKMAGFEYPYKNTTTLKEFLPQLTKTDTVKNGDLIWIPGHVMIVSDVTTNKLIEARSYPHGYGIVHEIELKDVFKNIKTYAQLLNASTENKIIYRLDNTQHVRDTIKDVKLLRLNK